MSYQVRVKICGVTTPADALAAVEAGADAVGLNFYPPSPRFVDAATASAILRELPPFVEAVGVFVDLSLADIVRQVAALERLRTVQWIGTRRELVGGVPLGVIQGFAVRDQGSLAEVADYLGRCREQGSLPRAVLVDAYVAGQHGGTGRTAPWDLLAAFRPGVPLILAGGLTPDNVAEAVRRVRPYAVDVASGVEAAPGRKDVEKMRRFIANSRLAGWEES
jgi:phosphoribosylanthranilate isomerase